jgi:cyclophilin family peptidyl-prolyl cis-trans isomerase
MEAQPLIAMAATAAPNVLTSTFFMMFSCYLTDQ